MIQIWHNPRCSKSRSGVKYLEERDAKFEIVKYLDNPPTAKEIADILDKLGMSARELMRTKETVYRELDLKNEQDEQKLIEVMAAHPRLIERPIVINGNKAVVGRPAEAIAEVL